MAKDLKTVKEELSRKEAQLTQMFKTMNGLKRRSETKVAENERLIQEAAGYPTGPRRDFLIRLYQIRRAAAACNADLAKLVLENSGRDVENWSRAFQRNIPRLLEMRAKAVFIGNLYNLHNYGPLAERIRMGLEGQLSAPGTGELRGTGSLAGGPRGSGPLPGAGSGPLQGTGRLPARGGTGPLSAATGNQAPGGQPQATPRLGGGTGKLPSLAQGTPRGTGTIQAAQAAGKANTAQLRQATGPLKNPLLEPDYTALDRALIKGLQDEEVRKQFIQALTFYGEAVSIVQPFLIDPTLEISTADLETTGKQAANRIYYMKRAISQTGAPLNERLAFEKTASEGDSFDGFLSAVTDAGAAPAANNDSLSSKLKSLFKF